MKFLQRVMQLLVVLVLFALATAFAQSDIPNRGACFYRDTGFRGSYFCVQAGQSMENVPSGFNDAIRSVRVFGSPQVTIFSDNRMAGASTTLRGDVRDLQILRLNNSDRNWSHRISSIRIDGYGGGRDGDDSARNRDWGYTWGNGQSTSGTAACFFDQPDYRGHGFCVERGAALSNLPSGFNDRIQSIRVQGGSEVQMFNDNNFGGVAARTSRDVSDLRSWNIPDDPSRNWSGRISSLRVDTPRGGGWNNVGGYRGYGDHDRDRDRHADNDRRDGDYDRQMSDDQRNRSNLPLVRCSSRPQDRRSYCDTAGGILDARLAQSQGNCQRDENWGIDKGRLWVSRGCSGDFEVQR